jgi:tetratricopeptide (TPR) repeat protein
MLAWDVAFGQDRPPRSRLPAYGAAAAALLLFLAVRFLVYRDAPYQEWPAADNPLLAAGFWSAKFTAVKVIGMDLWLLVCPLALAYDRSWAEIPPAAWSDAGAWAALGVVAALLLVAIARWRRDPLMFFLAGFFGIALLPTSNLALTIGNIMAERFLYVPSIAFAMLVAALGSRLALPPRIKAVAAAAMVALLAGRTWARVPAWNSNLALAASDVATAPSSFRVREMLAHALYAADPRGNLDAAIREQEAAWQILEPLAPRWIPAQTPMNLGGYYLEKGDLAGGDTAQARPWYEKAVAVLVRGREISQAAEKAYDDAQRAHRRPLRVRAAPANLYFNLGQAYGSLGRYPEALEALRFGRAIDPAQPQFYDSLAAAYAGLGQKDRAALVMQEKAAIEGRAVEGGVGCEAWAELAQAWDQARRPEPAREAQEKARGCAK